MPCPLGASVCKEAHPLAKDRTCFPTAR
jgi:hypothetical protein